MKYLFCIAKESIKKKWSEKRERGKEKMRSKDPVTTTIVKRKRECLFIMDMNGSRGNFPLFKIIRTNKFAGKFTKKP